MILHVSYSYNYCYKGVTFTWHHYCGPIIIRRGTEEGERKFRNISLRNWSAVNKFSKLSKKEQEKYIIN